MECTLIMRKSKTRIDDTYSEKEQCPNVSRIISAKYQISGKECISNHPFKFQVIRFIFLAMLSECISGKIQKWHFSNFFFSSYQCQFEHSVWWGNIKWIKFLSNLSSQWDELAQTYICDGNITTDIVFIFFFFCDIQSGWITKYRPDRCKIET